jgi:hypothetical protein
METAVNFARAREDEVPIGAAPDFASRHFSPAEVGEMWGLSADTVRRLFEKEAGVLLIGDVSRRGKRRYVTLRIPASVLARVHRKLTRVL